MRYTMNIAQLRESLTKLPPTTTNALSSDESKFATVASITAAPDPVKR